VRNLSFAASINPWQKRLVLMLNCLIMGRLLEQR
jgi:hypothetical protein